MGRMTYWNGERWMLKDGIGTFEQVVNRLGAYENTGIEPEKMRAVLLKVTTNGDILRSMTDAELASFMRLCEDGEIDYGLTFCSSCNNEQFGCGYCAANWMSSSADDSVFGLRGGASFWLEKIKHDAAICAKEAAEINRKIYKERFEAFLKGEGDDERPF